MNEFFSIILSIIILTFIDFRIWSIILHEKVELSNKKLYFFVPFMIISSALVNFYVTDSLRLFLTFSISVITCSCIFESKLQQKLLSVFVTQILLIASELIFVTISYYLLHIDVNKIATLYTGTLIMNTIVAILVLLLFKILCYFGLEEKLITFTDKINVRSMTYLLFIVMLISNLFIYSTYYRMSSFLFLILNSFTIIVYMIITYKLLEEQNKNLLIKIEYDTLLDKSVEYETMLDQNRRDTHENKNDLIVLDSLISDKDKEAKKQIKGMIEDYEKIEEQLRGNDNLYQKTLSIPSGGLRGLIYHKLVLCEQLGINYDLRVDGHINSKSLKTIDFEIIRKFVKIVGIYLDNAIEGVNDLERKEINVEVFMEDKDFVILIQNNFNGELDVEKIGTMGYSSKGGKHGYGLSLAQNILSNNENLLNETSIYRDIMTQIVKIKM